MNYQTLLADFLLGDRRIADRTDVQISIRPITKVRPLPESTGSAFTTFALSLSSPTFNYLLGPLHDDFVTVECDSPLEEREANLTRLLSLLLRYCDNYGAVQMHSDML